MEDEETEDPHRGHPNDLPSPPPMNEELDDRPTIDTDPVEGEAPGTRRVAFRAALLLGVAGMVAAGLFFARSLVSTGAGGATPTAAVERMFDALAQEDAIGVLETLVPSERRLLQGPIQDVTAELSRLGIFGDATDLMDINGLEVEFFGLRFGEEKLAPNITAVALREGRVRARFDPRGGLLGGFVTELLDRDASFPNVASADLAAGSTVIATVRDGDEWYVSLGYSIAENFRRDTGRVSPTFGQGVAIGAPTPEEAVGDLIRALAGLDISRLMQLMPPGEAGALHDYAQLLIAQVGSAAHDARGFFQAKITGLELSSRATSPDAGIVEVDRIGFIYEIPDLGLSIEYDGECAVYRFEGEPPERDCEMGIGPTLPFFLPLEELPDPDVGFVVVKERNEWFVSPTRTILQGLLGYLKVLEPADLDALKEFFESGSGEFEPPSVDPRATPTA